jgi:hypothetical protein
MRKELSPAEIEFLKSKGFITEEGKCSGFHFIEEDRKTTVLIPQETGYKLEFYELCSEDDGSFYEDFDKEYSKEGQSLEDFINDWI